MKKNKTKDDVASTNTDTARLSRSFNKYKGQICKSLRQQAIAIQGELGSATQKELSFASRDKTIADLTQIADTLNTMTIDSFMMNYTEWYKRCIKRNKRIPKKNKPHALGQGCTKDELKGAMSAYTQHLIECNLSWVFYDGSKADFQVITSIVD